MSHLRLLLPTPAEDTFPYPHSLSWCCPYCSRLWAILDSPEAAHGWVHLDICQPCEECHWQPKDPWEAEYGNPWRSTPGSLVETHTGVDEAILAGLHPYLLRREFDLQMRNAVSC